MKKSAILIILVMLICQGLWAGEKDIKPSNLYAPFNSYKIVQEDLDFWTKRDLNTVSLKKQAESHLGLFAIDGDLENLFKAEDKLNQAIEERSPKTSGIYRSLAQIKIKQHRFCEALEDLLKAEKLGDNLRYTRALLFDVYFELGNEEQTQFHLALLENENDFEYLIRAARYEDSEGRLDEAISYLEEAKEKIASNDWYRQSWIHSNLADFYGHAGEIEKSYDYFIKALEMNPADWYSLKGLAWIEYSAFGRSQKALEYLNKISVQYSIPAVEALKLEILEYTEDYNSASDIKNHLLAKIDRESYHSSYGTMIYDMLLGKNARTDETKNLVLKSLESRPTPETYALLCQWHLLMGDKLKAKEIASQYVVNQTFEPDALRRVLNAYDKDDKQFDEIVSMVREARFELGPVIMKELDL